MSEICKIVGSRIRVIRKQQKLSAEALAFESNLDASYITGIERGQRNPSMLVLDKIREVLGLEWEEMFEG
jgi:transcriptional regulator with XRE-family HTH domain